MIKAYWNKERNVGDTLTVPIVEFFTGKKVKFAQRNDHGKLIAVGSIMRALRERDIIWGAGIMHEKDRIVKQNVTVLAVRGRMTEQRIKKKALAYGDPALLLPLMYRPAEKKRYKVGVIPHYIDESYFPYENYPGALIISVRDDWKSFVEQVLQCETIVSTSLHGIIIAEAYGIPVVWLSIGDRIRGGHFKFHDYLTGTGRRVQEPGELPKIPNLAGVQEGLIKALKKHYGEN